MEISDKTLIVPKDTLSMEVVRTLKTKNIPIHAANTGIDLGVEMCAGRNRRNAKQRSRIKSASKRAARAKILARINRKCKRIAVTSVGPVQSYGNTVLGTSKWLLNKQRTNMARATGDHTGGTCATTLFR